MLDSFYSSVFCKKQRALGYTMHAFSIYHFSMLKAISSPFLTGGNISPADVIIFAKICSLKRSQGCNLNFTFRDTLNCAIMLRSENIFYKNLLFCAQHQKDNMQGPEYWESEQGISMRTLSAPYELALVIKLQESGFTDVWDLPLSYAQWSCAVIDELKGDVRTYSDPMDKAKKQSLDEILKEAEKTLNKKQLAKLKESIQCHYS